MGFSLKYQVISGLGKPLTRAGNLASNVGN